MNLSTWKCLSDILTEPSSLSKWADFYRSSGPGSEMSSRKSPSLLESVGKKAQKYRCQEKMLTHVILMHLFSKY